MATGGDEVHGDKVEGNKVKVGSIAGTSGPVNIAGGDIHNIHIEQATFVVKLAESSKEDDAARWPEAEARYRERMRKIHWYTRLLGNPKKIEIEEIYTDVYVLDKPSAISRYDLTELQKKPLVREQLILDRKRQPIMDLVRSEKRLFILGKPGAGKTTFLKYLTLQACVGKIKKTPIFISLKEWADSGLELMSFMVQLFDICDFSNARQFIEHSLKDGVALVLFDGLDEINNDNERGTKILQTLKQFAERYPKAQICITCRVAAVDYMFTVFSYIEIADFDDKQQNLFAEKWYQDDPEKLKIFLTEFGKTEYKRLRELAQTPLLLAIFCLVFDETSSFPTRRVDLYREILEALLKKWDSSRGIKRDSVYCKITQQQEERILAFIASQNFEAGVYFIRRETVVGQISRYLQILQSANVNGTLDSEIVLKTIESHHGILVERAHSIYSFSHLSLQEFFTAKFIVENEGRTGLQNLVSHVGNDRWREVFLMTANLLDNADGFCSLYVSALSNLISQDPVISCIFEWVQNKSRGVKTKYKQPALRAFYIYLGIRAIKSISPISFDPITREAFWLACELDSNLRQDLEDELGSAHPRSLSGVFAQSGAYELEFDIDLLLDPLPEQIIESLIERSKQLPSLTITSALEQVALSILPYKENPLNIPQKLHELCLDKLREIAIEYRDIGHNWEFDNIRVGLMTKILSSTRLLVECLQSSQVSIKTAIEEQLLTLAHGEYIKSLQNQSIYGKNIFAEFVYDGIKSTQTFPVELAPRGGVSGARFISESAPISVLFLAADPIGTSRLRLGEEFREIQEQINLSKQRDHFRLELPQLSVRPKDFSQALLHTKPQIVHFSGHGTSAGALCFENQSGEALPIPPDALAALFEQFASQVKCVVLNACYSEMQAKAIARHIDYVIGMTKAISDKAAIAFSVGFYQALGAGRNFEEAYKLGCVQTRLQGIPEHLTPVLIKKG